MSVGAHDITVGHGDHIVQFYERDADLLATVTPYLATALRAGEVAILIATEAHRREFEAELRAEGVDLVRARAEGRFLSLDAAATMALFRRGGRIDRDCFHEVIGGIVRAATGSSRRVRAYGEMVALLWEGGDVLGAIELEELWHELGREVSFSLFCSYPASAVSRPGDAEALRQVCRLHSAALDTPVGVTPELAEQLPDVEVMAEFAGESDMPGRARRLVVAALEQRGHDEILVGDAALVLSELASNAVLHAGSPFSVVVRTRDSRLRIAVSDSTPPLSSSPDGGLIPRPTHGLSLVQELCSCWGVEGTAGGKVVWAELPI